MPCSEVFTGWQTNRDGWKRRVCANFGQLIEKENLRLSQSGRCPLLTRLSSAEAPPGGWMRRSSLLGFAKRCADESAGGRADKRGAKCGFLPERKVDGARNERRPSVH